MQRTLPVLRFRSSASLFLKAFSTSPGAPASPPVEGHHILTTETAPFIPSAPPKTAPVSTASASFTSGSFLRDFRTEKAQRRWTEANRVTQASPIRSSRSSSTESSFVSLPSQSSAVSRPLVHRTMQAKNRVVVLHPEGGNVVTLDMTIELPVPATNGLAAPSSPSPTLTPSTVNNGAPLQPQSGVVVVKKSMAREEKEAASKTLDRIRLLFAPSRSSGKSSKRTTREQILTECPVVIAFCRSSDLAALPEEIGLLAAPGARSAVFSSLNETASYTELNPALPNSVFWKYAQVLRVNGTDVRVFFNVPTITSITSPGIPYIGLPLAGAGVSVLFASENSISYEWCVLDQPSASAHGGSYGESAFRVVGTEPTFTPTSDLQGKALMLRVSLDTATGLWTEMRLPDVVRPLPPPVSRWQETVSVVNYPVFRVVTYNILYDDFCTSKSSKAKIYPFATDDILDIENRKVRIAQELSAYHADIVCLQECGRDVFHSYLLPVMRACGYDGVYFNKSGSVKEGCGFLFRVSRFKLVQSASVPLNFNTLSSMFPALAGRVAACPELKEALSLVTSIGALVILQETTSGKEVVVGNTHLFYHANACHIRILQAYILVHWLNNAAIIISTDGDTAASPPPTASDRALHYRPLVLCGDFNCTHPTGAYRLLLTGQVEADHPSWDKGKLFWWGCARLLGSDPKQLQELLGENEGLSEVSGARSDSLRQGKSKPGTVSQASVSPNQVSAEVKDGHGEEVTTQEDDSCVITNVFHEALYGPPLRLQDAYHRTDPSMPWTNFALTFREVIDYIFFSGESLEVLRTVPIPPEAELTENFALPNKKYPSDHLALIADLAFTMQ